MNVGEVKIRVKRQFGDESGAQITDADIVRWINDGQRYIIENNEGILETISTATTIVGQRDYNLPVDAFILRSISIKADTAIAYGSLTGFSLQEFDQLMDGWDGTQFGLGRPTVYHVYGRVIKIFPAPAVGVVNGLKIYYSRFPVDVVLDTDIIDLPLNYHNAVVKFCLQQAYELDEDMDAANAKAAQVAESITLNKDRERRTHEDYYPRITVMPEDWEVY